MFYPVYRNKENTGKKIFHKIKTNGDRDGENFIYDIAVLWHIFHALFIPQKWNILL